MKKVYSKPIISVEAMSLDQPIANACDSTLKDEITILMGWGYFMDGKNCTTNLLPTGGFDTNNDGTADSHNTVCYHSNIQKAFIS